MEKEQEIRFLNTKEEMANVSEEFLREVGEETDRFQKETNRISEKYGIVLELTTYFKIVTK